jgi:hypothetical protein
VGSCWTLTISSPHIDFALRGLSEHGLVVGRGFRNANQVEARLLGESQPVLTNSGGADVVDLPKPGCWTFRLAWIAHSQPQVSTINLEVLPPGTRPAQLFGGVGVERGSCLAISQ